MRNSQIALVTAPAGPPGHSWPAPSMSSSRASDRGPAPSYAVCRNDSPPARNAVAVGPRVAPFHRAHRATGPPSAPPTTPSSVPCTWRTGTGTTGVSRVSRGRYPATGAIAANTRGRSAARR
jgi:hypothetical protein